MSYVPWRRSHPSQHVPPRGDTEDAYGEAPEALDDSADEDCWAHEPPRMHGAS